MRIAVILFPGTNCEEETKQAVESVGMEAEIVRWNEDPEKLTDFDGYIIPGGWSYEDRLRAGVIAAQDPIMGVIKKEAEKGKPVLGICNGCQVLVESGLIPHVGFEKVEMALAPNKNPFIDGYYSTWVHMKNEAKTAFTLVMEKDEVMPIPIAHGEGRFVTKNKEVLQKLVENNQIVLVYSTVDGEVKDEFPINPNGSSHNIAGVCNKEGNVLALMPHPERCNYNRQLPGFVGNFEAMQAAGPGRKIFESMKAFIENGNRIVR